VVCISNLATIGNIPRTATEESAKQEAATTGPKLSTFWNVALGQQDLYAKQNIMTAKKTDLDGEGVLGSKTSKDVLPWQSVFVVLRSPFKQLAG
jgi:hypothetical protein